VLAVERAARTAVATVRAGAGPYFLELQTYRFRAHSMYDPDRYRDKAEIAAWRKRDPIDLYTAWLRSHGELSDADLAAEESAITAEIDAAIAAAESAPPEPAADLTRYVYAESETTP
jgi:pyruvate dehydrogenase E1 component alpha subunit